MSGITNQAVRPPKQKRSRASYERVLAAAHQLLEENGFEGFTVQEVAARAGVSVGAIYERFGNKETLLHTVHARLMETISQFDATAAGPEPVGTGELIDALVARLAATMGEHREIVRAFMHIGALDEVIADRGSLVIIELGRRFKDALRPRAADFSHADPELALDVAFRVAYSTLARQIMYGSLFESEVNLGWDQLTAELAVVCRAYLLG